MLFLQIRAQRSRAKDANYHRTTYPIRHQIHVDTTTIRRVWPIKTTRIWATVMLLQFFNSNGWIERGKYFNCCLIVAVTPNSSIDATVTTNNNGSSHINASNVISADSSVASSVSMDEEDESPAKVKKKDDNHVKYSHIIPLGYLFIEWFLKYFFSVSSRRVEYQKRDLRWTKRLILQ